MAKRFRFDDEDDDIQVSDYQQPSHIDKLEELKGTPSYDTDSYSQEIDEFDFVDNDEEDDSMKKKKKKFVWKWWHYVLIGLGVLFIAFMLYIFVLSNNDGPVYGNRCEGISTISQENINSAISKVKEEYPEVQSITMEIACKQLKVDILFEDEMSTKKAKSIAEKSVQILDNLVGKEKESGKTYSSLFGYENNVAQFEVNLFLESSNSEDFPIYGTKHVQNDKFSYTLASIKDKESKEKAESTLEEK